MRINTGTFSVQDPLALNRAMSKFVLTTGSIQSENTFLYRLLGNMYAAQADWQQAARWLEQAQAFLPNDRFIAWDRSLVYEKQETSIFNRKVVLKQKLLQAWRGANVSPEKFARLGKDALNRHLYSEAILWYQRAITLSPDHAKLWYSLGLAHEGVDDWQSAAIAYYHAIELEPQWRDYWYKLGSVYKKLQQPDRALAALDQALQVRNGEIGLSIPYHFIGNILQEMVSPPDYVKAWAAYEKALAIDDYREGYELKVLTFYYRGQIQIVNKDWKKAVIEFQNSLSLNSQYESARFALTYTLTQLGDYSEAEKYLLEALAINPNNETAYLLLGDTYAIQGWSGQARTAYESALTLNPQNSMARSALARLMKK